MVSGGRKSSTVGVLMSCSPRDPCAGTGVEGNTPSGKLNRSWASQPMQNEPLVAHLHGFDCLPCVACHLACLGCSCCHHVDYADNIYQNEQLVAQPLGLDLLHCTACRLAELGWSCCHHVDFVDNIQNEPSDAHLLGIARFFCAACRLACFSYLHCRYYIDFVDESTKHNINLQKDVVGMASVTRPLVPRSRLPHRLAESCRRGLPVELKAGPSAYFGGTQPTARVYERIASIDQLAVPVRLTPLATNVGTNCKAHAVAFSTAGGPGTTGVLDCEVVLAGDIIHLMAFMPGIAHSSIKQSDGEFHLMALTPSIAHPSIAQDSSDYYPTAFMPETAPSSIYQKRYLENCPKGGPKCTWWCEVPAGFRLHAVGGDVASCSAYRSVYNPRGGDTNTNYHQLHLLPRLLLLHLHVHWRLSYRTLSRRGWPYVGKIELKTRLAKK